MATTAEPQTVAEFLAPFLTRVQPEHVPLLLALAERRAAVRYRAWADAATDDDVRARLRECAEREEEIARRVESLFDDPAALQQIIRAQTPDLDERVREAFDTRSLREQLALQAEGERLGAATWRSLARKSDDTATRDALPICAGLEERSAEVLEAVLADASWPFDRA